jgi:phage terminase small subunit
VALPHGLWQGSRQEVVRKWSGSGQEDPIVARNEFDRITIETVKLVNKCPSLGQTAESKGDAGMTPRMEMFCQEYCVDFNATSAAVRAGYSAKSAHSIGHENLNKPEIQERIAEIQASRRTRLRATADFVIASLVEMAADRDVGDSARKGALELLGKHLGLFTEKMEHSTTGGEAINGSVVFYLPDNKREDVPEGRMMESNGNGNGKH